MTVEKADIFKRLLGKTIEVDNRDLYLLPVSVEVWELAIELRNDFTPSTVSCHLSAFLDKTEYRQMYRHFMLFAQAAHKAKKPRD